MPDGDHTATETRSPKPRNTRPWWRDPFVVFLAIGAALFAIERLRPAAADRTVVIDEAAVERLQSLWLAQSSRLPTRRELQALIDDAVREEVLYREAIQMGLDRDDTIVRRRLAQKMGFLLDDTARSLEPDESALRQYHREHADRYREPARWTFRHIYFSVDRRGAEEATADAEALLEQLRSAASSPGPWRSLGDPFMLQREYAARSRRDLTELFGSRFAEQLQALTPQQRQSQAWLGPMRSALGVHLVQIERWQPAADRTFEQTASEVREDWTRDRRLAANEAAYREILDRYIVDIAELPQSLPGDPPPEDPSAGGGR